MSIATDHRPVHGAFSTSMDHFRVSYSNGPRGLDSHPPSSQISHMSVSDIQRTAHPLPPRSQVAVNNVVPQDSGSWRKTGVQYPVTPHIHQDRFQRNRTILSETESAPMVSYNIPNFHHEQSSLMSSYSSRLSTQEYRSTDEGVRAFS